MKTEDFIRQSKPLAVAVGRDPGISVKTGEGTWSISTSTAAIRIVENDLALLGPDLCTSLIIHEAGHAAISRYLQIMHAEYELDEYCFRRDELVLQYLNLIEDIRLEAWLARRFPGNRQQVALRDRHFRRRASEKHPEGYVAGCRFASLFYGISALFWKGRLEGAKIHPEAAKLIKDCTADLVEAVASQPPVFFAGGCPPAFLSHPAYALFPDAAFEPGEAEVVMAAYDSIQALERLFLPTLRQWIDEPGQEPVDASVLMEEFFGDRDCRNTFVEGELLPAKSPAAGTIMEAAWQEVRKLKVSSELPRYSPFFSREEERAFEAREREKLDLDLRKIAPRARHLAKELSVLLAKRKLRESAGGSRRLNLRAAMRAETAPLPDHELWKSRPGDPVAASGVLMIVDTSGSMERGERAESAFEGVLLLRSALRHLGIPAGTICFADQAEWIERPGPLPAETPTLYRRIQEPFGDTRFSPPAAEAMAAIHENSWQTPLVIWITDGGNEESEQHTTTLLFEGMRQLGARLIGLGLGSHTAKIAEHFPDGLSAHNLRSKDLAAALSRIARAAIALAPAA